MPVALCQYGNCSATGEQLVVSILTLGVVGIYLIGYPVYLTIHTYSYVLITEDDEYAEFIRLKEMEYLLGVSHDWLVEKLYLFSSYRSSWLRVYHRSIYYCFVLSLVVLHSALNTTLPSKLLVLLIICVGFTLYITLFPVYRCLSSSYLYALCMWVVTINLFMGFLKAWGYQSQSMIDSNLVDLLVAINVTAFVIIGLFVFLIFFFRVKWPVGADTIKQLAAGYRYMLTDLRNAQQMILTLRAFNSFRFVRKDPVEKMIELLTEHFRLLNKENHPLQHTVVEQMDILDSFRHQIDSETWMPCRNLERDYPILVSVVNRRWREQILMSPVKRRILLKLVLLRMFLGNRETKPFNSGEDTNYLEKGTKGMSEFDLNKFYREFEDMESSREMIGDGRAELVGEIDHYLASNNREQLIKITEMQIAARDPEILDYLKNIWNQFGLESLPHGLHAQLFKE